MKLPTILSEITGDAKYRDAADAALTKFLEATPSPNAVKHFLLCRIG